MDGSTDERGPSGQELCGCCDGPGAPSLAVLQDVQRAYQQRMDMLEKLSGYKKQKMQMELLRAWVFDLAEQNTLLANTVEELETEVTSRLLMEQRKHSECDKRCLCGKVNELKQSNETLHKENISKDREIRKLHKDAHQYEQTILNLRNELSLNKYQSPDVSKKDAEVMAGMCCTVAECGDWEPVKEFDSVLHGEMANYQERIKKMEASLKCSGGDVRALRNVNVGLRVELNSLHGVCAALTEKCRAAALRSQFKDEIIREMRRQLKRAKAKIREAPELVETKPWLQSRDPEVAFETVNKACVRQQPRRSRDFMSPPPSRSLSADGECLCNVTKCGKTSTPNGSRQRSLVGRGQSPDVSIIETVHPISASNGPSKDKRREEQVPKFRGIIERLFFNKRVSSSSSCVGQRGGKCASSLKIRTKSKSATELSKKPSIIKLEAKSASICIDPKESECGSSGTASPNSSGPSSARAQYYENKLLATLEILENKEETIRAKVESLSVAVAKIANLTARDVEQKKEISQKEREIQTLRKILEDMSKDKFEDKVDVSVTAIVEGNCSCREENKRLQRVIGNMVKDKSGLRKTIKDLETRLKEMDVLKKNNLEQMNHRKIEESMCGSSTAVSPSSSSSTRAHYENKLLATLQILENKEETIRVQAKSLSVAEERIATLTARDTELKKEIDRRGKEIQTLRKNLEDISKDKFEDKVDVSVAAKLQDMETRDNVVITLQNNLSVIEDLYRESFYETVKQENLVEMLRQSCLDVRLMDKGRCEHISRLNNVINTQQWSLDRCQDIATEVDNLKAEISNFLNNSNNDSGMWEESMAGELTDDLRDIAAQLLRLGELLIGDCTCGLDEENKRLARDNKEMEKQICGLRSEVTDLESRLKEMREMETHQREQIKNMENRVECTCELADENERLKSDNNDLVKEICSIRTRNRDLENRLQELDACDKQCQELIEKKENELRCIRDRIASMECDSEQQISCCETLTRQLSQVQEILTEKSTKLVELQNQCAAHEQTIRGLRGILENVSNENASLRSAAAQLQRRVCALDEQLARATTHGEHVEACYREKARSGLELEAQLDEAHARGAQLCGEARRVVGAVRAWARRMQHLHREQEEQIKLKESELRLLQEQLAMSPESYRRRPCRSVQLSTSISSLTGERQRYPAAGRPSEMEPTCSKYPAGSGGNPASAPARERRDDASGRTCVCVRDTRADGAAAAPAPRPRAGERRGDGAGTSASEAMGSTTPEPPKRAPKKRQLPCTIRTPLLRGFAMFAPGGRREAGVQAPRRREAAAACRLEPARAPHRCMRCVCAPPAPAPAPPALPVSPAEEMFSRIESISDALADGYRRWSRRGAAT